MRRFIGLAVVALVASQMALIQTATAHDPLVDAEVICDESGEGIISWTVTAWGGDGSDASRTNPSVEVYVNYQLVATGAFTAPEFSFSGTSPIPDGKAVGDTVAITTQVTAPWGNGYPAGGGDGFWVTIPELDCGDPTGEGRFTGGGSAAGS